MQLGLSQGSVIFSVALRPQRPYTHHYYWQEPRLLTSFTQFLCSGFCQGWDCGDVTQHKLGRWSLLWQGPVTTADKLLVFSALSSVRIVSGQNGTTEHIAISISSWIPSSVVWSSLKVLLLFPNLLLFWLCYYSISAIIGVPTPIPLHFFFFFWKGRMMGGDVFFS